jgi:hypothetical protein
VVSTIISIIAILLSITTLVINIINNRMIRKTGAIVKKQDYVCGCKHHLAHHSPDRPHKCNEKIYRNYSWVKCGCQRYVGLKDDLMLQQEIFGDLEN